MLYYGIIFCFVIGAVLGNICINYLKGKAILVCRTSCSSISSDVCRQRERGKRDCGEEKTGQIEKHRNCSRMT